jgi:TPR repeat protein
MESYIMLYLIRFRKACYLGNRYAQFNLGCCYFDGEGIDRNLKKATFWLKKSAEQGISSAQANLAWCYFNGAGVEKDLKAAYFWKRKSIENAEQEKSQNNFKMQKIVNQ